MCDDVHDDVHDIVCDVVSHVVCDVESDVVCVGVGDCTGCPVLATFSRSLLHGLLFQNY